MIKRHRILAAGMLSVTVSLLVGCASVADAQPTSGAPDMPKFTGPFAIMLEDEYQIAPAGFARDVIRDGRVTDQERAETVERFRTCLAEVGTNLISFDDQNGSYELSADNSITSEEGMQASDASDQKCYVDSGLSSVDFVYREMRANPENRDFSEIMVECLKKAQAVPEGYTQADFDREYPAGEITLLDPDLQHTPDDPVMICQHDPLGLVNGAQQ